MKRNIAAGLLLLGLACTAARVWYVCESPASGKAWLELAGIIIITYCCFDRYLTLHRRVNRGIKYGAE